jgi:hypothetical protein
VCLLTRCARSQGTDTPGTRRTIEPTRLQKVGVGEVVEPRDPGAGGRGASLTWNAVQRALLGAAIAIEQRSDCGGVDACVTASYANAVLDNCRALAADDSRPYLPLVRKHLLWMQSLAAGPSLESQSITGPRRSASLARFYSSSVISVHTLT